MFTFAKSLLVLLVLLNVVVTLPADRHVPPAPNSRIEFETHVRAFWRFENWEPMISVDGRAEDQFDVLYRSLTLGSYYRLHRNLKVGGFYRLQQGARHDDDWVATNNSFEWKNTNSRTEHVFFADISPRFLLEMLPGESWVLMLKNRYFYNTFNHQQWLTLRPGLTWFWVVDREPLLNIAANYEFYVPLNFAETLLYGHGPYLNILYHISPTIKLDATVARRTRIWSTSEDVQDDPAYGDYEKKIRSWLLGLGVILRFS